MKKIKLLLAFVTLCFAARQSSFAQCEFSNSSVELNSVNQSGGVGNEVCTVNLNLKFTIDRNNGNKYTYIHLWKASQHPTITYGNSDKGPHASELGPVLATIAIDWGLNNVATLINTYSPDPTIIFPLFTGVAISQSISGSLYTVTIDNLSFAIPGACADIPPLKADVWGTQSDAKNAPIHCGYSGYNLIIDDPRVSGAINCNGLAGPRTYNLDIITTSVASFDIVYKLYLDDDTFISPGGTQFSPTLDHLFYTSPTTSISAGSPIDINAAAYAYATGESERSIWVVVTGPSLPNTIIAELLNFCDSPLPVKLAQFRGDLLGEAIALSWVTTQESGSSRFDIERSASGKEFATIGSVNASGNSGSTQNYSFLDKSPFQGINYYRLKQLDKDGGFERSRIITVANSESILTFELMGNPVQNREIRFMLKNEDPRNISLLDLNGRAQKFTLSKEGNIYSVKPVNYLSQGLYLLSLRSNKATQSKKVLVP